MFFSPMSGLQIYLKETPAQVFSYEICEMFTNTFYTEHLYSGGYSKYYKRMKTYTTVNAAKKEMIYLNGTFKVSVSR